jgi:predicted SnoaL-like aldol condensation-catalyzing enzyme
MESKIESHKQAAIQFLQLVVSGRIDEAYDKFVDMKGRHHNPYYPAGLPALRKGMIDNEKVYANKHISIKNVLGDGDLVAVHSHIILNPAEPGMIVVHLFRFSGDKIVEFWDCGQVLTADSPNKDGAF